MQNRNEQVEFSLITWNVWFDLHYVVNRINAQISEILFYKPMVVCLQEMTDIILDILKNNKELCKNYVIASDQFSTKPYGEIMLINKNLQTNYKYYSIPFPKTKMSRRISVLYLERYNLCIMNTHLESEFNKPDIKQQQAIYLFKYAQYILSKGFAEYVILAGDMNISNNDEKWIDGLTEQYGIIDSFLYLSTLHNPTIFQDAGEGGIISPNTNTYTYDYAINTNIQGKHRSRLDRVLILGNKPFVPTRYNLIGTNAFDVHTDANTKIKKCFPSDHFGIYVIFQFKK